MDLQDEEVVAQVVLAITNSYPLQRIFLNNVEDPPNIEKIQEHWPCLLKRTYMEIHFIQLTGKETKNITAKIEEDIPKLLAYGQMKKFIDSNEASTEDQKNLLALKAVFHHFKEDYTKLFVTVDASQAENVVIPYAYPLILVSTENQAEENGDEGSNVTKNKYHLIIEYAYTDTVDNIKDAVSFLIMAYFVFNKTWPKEVSCFLEFVQMRWLEIYPLDATRAKSKVVTDKVYSFFRKLAVVNSNEVL